MGMLALALDVSFLISGLLINGLISADERLELSGNRNVFVSCLCENTVCDVHMTSTENNTYHVTSATGNNQSISEFNSSSFICIRHSSESVQCLNVPPEFRLPDGSAWCLVNRDATCAVRFALLRTQLYDADLHCNDLLAEAAEASGAIPPSTQRSASSAVHSTSKDDRRGSDVSLIVNVFLVAVISVIIILNGYLVLMLRRKQTQAIERKKRFQRCLQDYNAVSVASVNTIDITYLLPHLHNEANLKMASLKSANANTKQEQHTYYVMAFGGSGGQ